MRMEPSVVGTMNSIRVPGKVGFTAWTAFELPDGAVLAYSFGYNAAYMIPETILTVIVLAFLSKYIKKLFEA